MKLLESLVNGDSLPAVNSSTSLIFRISNSYFDQSHICNFPGRSSSFFVTKDWLESELVKGPYKTRIEQRDTLSEYDYFCLSSPAPHGYEYEPCFIEAASNISSLPTGKKEFNNLQVVSHKLYETDKVLRHTRSVSRVTYMKHLNLLTTTLIKKKTSRVCFFKETNQLVSYHGLKLTPKFCNSSLPHNFRTRLNQIIQKKSPSLLPLIPTHSLFNDFTVYRKALLNPLWKDLNSKYALDEFKSQHPDYRKMLYAYKHKGTKQARHIVYSTSNKALIRYFEKNCTSEVINCVKYIMQTFSIAPEKMLHLLQKVDKESEQLNQRSTAWRLYMFMSLKEIHEQGYTELTVDRLVTLCIANRERLYFLENELRDIAHSLRTLKNSGTNVTYPAFKAPFNLSLFSTQLGKMVAEIRDKQFSIPFPHADEAHEYYDHEDDNYTFTFADNASLLRSCGNEMSICVGGYGNRARERQCDIVLVYKKSNPETPYSCLEVRTTESRRSSGFFGRTSSVEHKLPYELQQAKLYRNQYAKTDKTLAESILTWCELKEIYPETRDLVDDDFARTVELHMTLEQERGENPVAQLFDDLPF